MNADSGSVSRRRSLFIWSLFCILAGAIFLAYVFASLAVGRGELVMPLDDVYIHFQYARQLAAGQPYVYNPGLPASSGATSFLYPYVLAAGYLLGFQGLNLGLWAMAAGALALLASIWLVYRLSQAFGTSERGAVLTAIIFALSGPMSWHFMSGMETGLAVMFTLLTLYGVVIRSVRGSIAAASLLALIRPEGGLLAVVAMIILFLDIRPTRSAPVQKQTFFLLIPILCVGVQPFANWLFTGSAVASGNAAKSLFGMVPPFPDVLVSRIADNFSRMWLEFLTSISPREGLYIPLLVPLMLVGFFSLRQQKRIIWLLVGWMLVGTLAVSTLDPAFWHFKRYQMPVIALFYPLMAAGVVFLLTRWSQIRPLVYVGAAISLALALWTGTQFLQHYALNVGYITLQPLQMARWLDANTPPEAIVAVHDTGLIRYLGGRTTLDMVGLTTPGAAEYWRNGPGSVAEFLLYARPDYIASYGIGHGLGLGMIAETSIYGEPLASFPVAIDPHYNVALAADFQGIYQPDWGSIPHQSPAMQSSIADNYLPDGATPLDTIDVANIASETAANYHWQAGARVDGFPTEVREFDYIGCVDCRVVDGGRLITGEESFDVRFDSDEARPILLVTRIHPMRAGAFDVYANGEQVATRWIPELPGSWLEIPTLIPSELFSNPLHIRIVPNGVYMPFYHAAFDGSGVVAESPNEIVSTYQEGAIVLSQAAIHYESDNSRMEIAFDWYTDGSARGDYKIFVHVLDDSDAIVAQTDQRPGHGTLPPGNWLAGVLHDTIMVDLSAVQPGTYRVAIGLYDPITFESLVPSMGGDAANRLFIGQVEIVDG